MSARTVTTCYAVTMSGLVICYFVVPAVRPGSGLLVGLVSATAVAFGVRRHRPRRGYSWWLLATGLVVFAAGDTVYLFAGFRPAGLPDAVSEFLYLLMLPLVGAGLLGLTRSSTGARDRSGLLDFLIFSTAAVFLFWVFLIHPYLVGSGFGNAGQSATAAYLLADALLLATVARLLATTRCNAASVLLLIGATGLLIADLSYAAESLHGVWRPGAPDELGWFALYGAWGAAALHPSMAALTEPAEPRSTGVGKLRLVLLGAAALLAPGVLLLQVISGQPRDATVIAVVSGVTFVLVVSRLADVADAHRSAVARERSLRQAGAALVTAVDAKEVDRAVRAAVARLVPRNSSYRIVFAVNSADGVPATAMSIWGPAVAAPSSFYPAPTAAVARRSRVLRVQTLHPALAEQLRGFEAVVLCPLVGDERAAGVPRVGALLVAADAKVLPELRDSLEVLAAQVALVLERISLGQEIGRRNSEEYFRSLVQNAADIILIMDGDQRIRYASPSLATVLGVDPAECTDLRAVVHPDDQTRVSALLESTRPTPEGTGRWVDWSIHRPDGQLVHLEVSCRDLRRDRAVRGLVLTMRDVSERQRLEQELLHRSIHDTLTGLANRASFQDQVHDAVEKAREGNRTVGTLSIDLDEFTAVNDTHGQAIGDGLLVAAGQRLRAEVGDAGMVARLGGDEFAVMVRDADDPAQVERIADHLVRALTEPIAVAGTVVSGSASIGVATTAEANDAGELLQRADLALYVAKRAGKSRWCRYQSELHTAIVERLELRTALAEAVEKRGFSVEYQPIVAMDSGRSLGFEALARWHHPSRGAVPPAQFIALAEETGLIEPIGEWVLRQAIAAVARWYAEAAGENTPYVSINVSARQLRTDGFAAMVRSALATADVPPARVMLEITESLLLRDEEPVWAELSELRALGLRVAIDDFGTGFSSLSYLQQMPADVLKLDRSFTGTVASSRRQRLLVEGIVRLASTLGLEIIAEGVETEAVRTTLLDMGCSSGQGFLFSRPLSDTDTAQWLRGER